MASDTLSTSRRGMLQGAAVGLAAATAMGGTAAAQEAKRAAAAPPPANPVDKFPAPPFAQQSQPWPALASKMDPRPDHGEDSYKGSGRLAGRRALVTGGDSGIGRAAVIAFAREGADVAINYHPDEEADAQEVVALIRDAGRKAVAIPGDLLQDGFCKRMVDRAVAELGGLDILVNNAAYQQAKESIADITDEQFDRTFKTNIYAPFWTVKAALPHLQPGAAIINTASINSYDPAEYILDYASTKGAIMIFTKALAKQLAAKGIRVNAVAPGPVWTPLQVAGGQLPEGLAKFGGDTPLKRPGQPAELASLYVTLAEGGTSYSTGQVFGATGGRGGP